MFGTGTLRGRGKEPECGIGLVHGHFRIHEMDDAGSRAASGMSLIAKANGLDPHVWLSDVLARLPTAKARDIDTLLPLRNH